MDGLILGLLVAIAGLAAVMLALFFAVRRLKASVECLCTNLGGLREQIGQGGHGHA